MSIRENETIVSVPKTEEAKDAAVIGVADGGITIDPEVRGRRVLIIDDDMEVAEALRDLLLLMFTLEDVAIARNGPEGLQAARTLPPDLVLCDLSMPRMDGYDVARAFRADSTLRRSRLVALTGFAQPEDLQRTAGAGFDHHLGKPPELEELEKLLQNIGS